MPYYHRGCNGLIKWYPPLPIPPRCARCGKRWSPFVLYGLPPKDMVFEHAIKPKLKLKKGKTAYAKWADQVPMVSFVASRLPNWPRWARILVTLAIATGLVFLVRFTLGGL